MSKQRRPKNAAPAAARKLPLGLTRAEASALGIGLAIRLIHWAGMLGDPLIDHPRMDPLYHDTWARAIAGGDLTFDGPFFRAPLYAYFLGGIYALGGSIAAARLAQLLIGLGTAFLVMRIGKRTLGERAGVVAGGLWGIYPIALRYEGDLLVEGLFICFAMTGILQYLRCRAGSGGRGWFAAGILFGLAVITRPTILSFVVLLPAVEWLTRRVERGPGAPSVRGWVALALGLVLPILPVTAHNWFVGHDWVPIASQGGVNFMIGNNPKSDGYTAIVPGTRATWWGGHDDAVALAEAAVGRKLKPSEVSDYWFAEGKRFIREEPAAAARLTLRKAFLCFWGAEISNNEHIYFLRRYSLPMRLTLWYFGIYFPFGLVAPLGLVGIAMALRRRAPGAILLSAYTLVYAAAVIAFFVCARFRLPVIPVLLLFAVYAGLALCRRPRATIGWTAAVLALALLFNSDPYRLNASIFGSQALSYLDLGAFQMQQGHTAEAKRLLTKAAELDPGHPAPHAFLGRIALQAGQLELAEKELRLATRGDPVLFRDVVTQAQRDLGRLAIQRGWFDRARIVYELSLELDPSSAESHAGAGIAAGAMGDSAGAAAHFAQALAIDPENAVARAGMEKLAGKR